MRWRTASTGLLSVALMCACGGQAVQVSRAAVVEAGEAFGRQAVPDVQLGADDLRLLASRAGVAESVIADVAPRLEQQPLWQRSLTSARTVYDKVPGDARSNVMGLACEVARGEITTREQLQDKILERFVGLTENGAVAIRSEVEDIQSELTDAMASQDPERQAAAAVTCFAVEKIGE